MFSMNEYELSGNSQINAYFNKITGKVVASPGLHPAPSLGTVWSRTDCAHSLSFVDPLS